MSDLTRTPACVIEAFGQCLAERDLDGALALYEPDAVFQATPDAPALCGRDAIRGALEGFFALRARINGEIVKVHEAGGIAFVANRWTLRGTRPDGTPVELGGTRADVIRVGDDGMWRILVDDPWGAA